MRDRAIHQTNFATLQVSGSNTGAKKDLNQRMLLQSSFPINFEEVPVEHYLQIALVVLLHIMTLL